MTSNQYTLFYFPIPGLAEASRIALSLANLEWKDEEINREKFEQMKKSGELPWGLVPILKTPNGTLAESSAILRYIGKKAGLIPKDTFLAAKVDEYMDAMEPNLTLLRNTFIEDLEERIQVRKSLFKENGEGTKKLKKIQQKISESTTGWIANTPSMTIVDLKVFTRIFGIFSGNWDGIDKTILANYQQIINYHDIVSNEPRIKAHYNNLPSDSLRWTYQPGAFSSL